jgi:hypothetical protein
MNPSSNGKPTIKYIYVLYGNVKYRRQAYYFLRSLQQNS